MTTEKALVLEYSRVSRSRFVAIMVFFGGCFLVLVLVFGFFCSCCFGFR